MNYLLAFQDTTTTVTITFDLSRLITWLIVGLIAGVLASALVRGGRMGLGSSILVGLVGALLGGFLFTALGLPVSGGLATNAIEIKWIDLIVAFVGSLLILLIAAALFGR